MKILLIILFAQFSFVNAHVSWLFPEPRWPHFDYTNNRDNEPPCGLAASKNSSSYQTFLINKSYTLKWRMQYNHKGGFQVNLLDSDGKLLRRLLPASNGDQFFDTEMLQIQEIDVKFGEECEHCILQLMRQALDLGEEFRFFTCSDIRIVGDESKVPIDQQKCDKLDGENNGDYCTQKEDCKTDKDCGSNGICKEQLNSEYKKVCYCEYGKFGRNCEIDSTLLENDDCFNYQSPSSSSPQFDMHGMFQKNCYKLKALNEHDSIYSRVIKNEFVEIIMDFKTESYVAIGWRPLLLEKDCKTFPDVSLKNGGFNQKGLNAIIHPMYCTDVIWASVINSTKLMIRDGYSRDKSTPLNDEDLGGTLDLVAAYGYEANERTVVMFRRKIQTPDSTDHPLGPGRLFGIYAKGQKENEKKSITREAVEAKENKDRVFIKKDELMYHGNDYRAMATFHFVSVN